ncbi:MAG: hscB [Verrucomicrobiales bacterium]|nr:hscB [Verrucomicrobiales bacterium]
MTDYFQLLQEPWRPWLDAEALKSRFLERSSTVHPDRIHNAPEAEKQAANFQYTELNAAYQTLREPKERLLHLLTLETGSKPKEVQAILPGAMDLFLEVAGKCREVDSFIAEKNRATSPLIKVQFFAQGQEWTERLQELLQRIQKEHARLSSELQALNPIWGNAPAPGSPERPQALPLARVEEMYRAFSYINKWTAQLQERIVQLAF